MSVPQRLYLVPPPPPEEPAAAPAPRRVAVAVVTPDGVGALASSDTRRLREVADVEFHCAEERPDLGTAVRLLDGVEILAVTEDRLPVLDEALLDRAMSLRGVVVLGRRTGVDLRPLRLRGVGLDVVVDDVAGTGRARWADHILAAVGGAPRDPVTWPSAVPDLSTLPALRVTG
jgi:hypothetical protein